MTSGTLSQYYLDKINVANDNETIISKAFAYKTKLMGAHQMMIIHQKQKMFFD